MWNIIMRAFREGLEQEQKEIEPHVSHVLFWLLYLFLVFLILLVWIDQLIRSYQIHYRDDENHVE